MFEAIVANFLNRILGRYVANLEQNQLKLSIFSGIAGCASGFVRQCRA